MRAAVLVLACLGAGCASPRKAEPTAQAPVRSELSHGYALLYELVSKQSGLSRALVLGGGMSEPAKALVREIAEASKDAAARIQAFAQADPALSLEERGLPEIEAQARDLLESSTTGSLLFAGKRFEPRLMVAQADATDYGAALAKALAQKEDDPQRRAWLNEFAQRYGKLHERVESLLTVRGG